LPYGHWKSTTFVGGLTLRGFVAPMVLDGPMTSDAFTAYIEQVLAKETKPGDLVILDNLSSHKTAKVQAAFNRCGIDYQYLPPYSRDFNPIENAFSKLKRLVGSARRANRRGPLERDRPAARLLWQEGVSQLLPTLRILRYKNLKPALEEVIGGALGEY